MQEVARLLSTGKLKAVIAKTFPLEEAAYVTCLLCASARRCVHACIDSADPPRETLLWLFLAVLCKVSLLLLLQLLTRLHADCYIVAALCLCMFAANGVLHVLCVFQGRT